MTRRRRERPSSGTFTSSSKGVPIELVDTSCVSGHVNVPHGSHTTNLHTHGLARRAGLQRERHGRRQHVPARTPACRWPDPQVVVRAPGAGPRAARARRRGAYEHPLGNVQRSAPPAGRPPQPHPPGHALVSPARARLDARPGRQRPRRIPHRRRRRRRRDQSGDDGDRSSRSVRQDRAVRLPRAADAHPARRGFSVDVDAGPRRGQARIAPPTAINGGFSPTTMFMRPGAVERWRVLNGERRWPRIQVLHGARGAVRLLRPPVVAGPAGGKARCAAPLRGRRRGRTSPTRRGSCFSCRSTASRWSRSRTAARATRSAILSQQNAGTRNPARSAAGCTAKTRRARCSRTSRTAIAMATASAPVRPAEPGVPGQRQSRRRLLQGAARRRRQGVHGLRAGIPAGDRQLPAAAADGHRQRPSRVHSSNPAPVDVVVGYIKVSGEPVPGGDFDVMTLRDKLPPVPPFLLPVEDRRTASAGRRRPPTGRARRAASGRA